MSGRRWLALAPVTLALAGVMHVAMVKAIPIAITTIFMKRLGQQAGVNHVVANGLPTDKSRAVVKPSPDLLYAACIYDVSRGPVHMAIKPPETYWSLSLYAGNTDNFFKLGAADTTSGTVEIVLGRPADAATAKARYPSATFVPAASEAGVMLARILVLDHATEAIALAAQKSVRCDGPEGRG
jgi:uncharacterized membrane protein